MVVSDSKAEKQYEFLIEDYRQRMADMRDALTQVHRTTDLAVLLSGTLLALASNFGDDLLGERNERSFMLLLASLLYISLTWRTLMLHYDIATMGDFVTKHLTRNINELTGLEGLAKATNSPWRAEEYRRNFFASGPWEFFMNAILTVGGGYALTVLPVFVLWGAFVALASDGDGLRNLGWEAQTLVAFNLLCAAITVPLIWRGTTAYMPD